ncbi:MAG: 4-(cytidine 5'-diphospho)-2-C-methyl-D-erythritol kinase [Chloroflexota bacterium]|nr:4-(cytidine 5'-diphospho)-2-C-methyl-D-erythritol kinase [Chloroflexota bacterium]
MIPISLEAPAKLNLSLRVVGRRADGYHLLETEMVLLELADRLLLLPGATGLRVEAPPEEEIPVDRRNLAWRGLLAGLGAEPELVCLALEKRIPAASGLGGGSSDAAAAWRLGRHASGAAKVATAEELVELALLGADVPFFAAQCVSARVEGVGERVAPLPPPTPAQAILVHPGFRLSTQAVFAELRPGDLATDRPESNDLLAPALRLRPELADVLRQVADACGEARLTGSGSTVFALSDDPARMAGMAAQLRRAGLRTTETRIRSAPTAIRELHDAPDDGGAPPSGVG